LCSLSLEPDFCVKDTQSLFRKLGPMSVVIAKFMPGLQTLAPPMSGLTGMNLWLFLALDTLGTLIWASIFLSFGYYFHTELELLAERIAEAGLIAGIVTVTLVTTYFSWKLVKRRQFLKNLQMRRMTPDEVKMRIQQGDDLKILDLRHDYDVNSIPHLLPGALRVPMESIELHHRRIPKDSDIVLYCS
jgi:hypothetical protein